MMNPAEACRRTHVIEGSATTVYLHRTHFLFPVYLSIGAFAPCAMVFANAFILKALLQKWCENADVCENADAKTPISVRTLKRYTPVFGSSW